MFKKKQDITIKSVYDKSIDAENIAHVTLARYREDIDCLEIANQLQEEFVAELNKIIGSLQAEVREAKKKIKRNHDVMNNLGELIGE